MDIANPGRLTGTLFHKGIISRQIGKLPKPFARFFSRRRIAIRPKRDVIRAITKRRDQSRVRRRE